MGRCGTVLRSWSAAWKEGVGAVRSRESNSFESDGSLLEFERSSSVVTEETSRAVTDTTLRCLIRPFVCVVIDGGADPTAVA